MTEPSRKVDEFGFPIPPTFGGEPERQSAVWPKSRAWQVALITLMGLVAIGVAVGPQLVERGRNFMAERAKQRGMERLGLDNDPEGAVEEFDRAASWNSEDVDVLFWRAQSRLAANDVEAALEELNHVIELVPGNPRPYLHRSIALQRLERHREAIDDTTTLISLSERSDHNGYNQRAYTRAIAGIELEEGLNDIEHALKFDRNNAAYLDTRAYLRHLLGKNDLTLADIRRALRTVTRDRSRFEHLPVGGGGVDPRVKAYYLRTCDENEAVMLQHRGLIYQAQGKDDLAAKDFDRAQELGYNPAAGVY